jgi:hypothetical protein
VAAGFAAGVFGGAVRFLGVAAAGRRGRAGVRVWAVFLRPAAAVFFRPAAVGCRLAAAVFFRPTAAVFFRLARAVFFWLRAPGAEVARVAPGELFRVVFRAGVSARRDGLAVFFVPFALRAVLLADVARPAREALFFFAPAARFEAAADRVVLRADVGVRLAMDHLPGS